MMLIELGLRAGYSIDNVLYSKHENKDCFSLQNHAGSQCAACQLTIVFRNCHSLISVLFYLF